MFHWGSCAFGQNMISDFISLLLRIMVLDEKMLMLRAHGNIYVSSMRALCARYWMLFFSNLLLEDSITLDVGTKWVVASLRTYSLYYWVDFYIWIYWIWSKFSSSIILVPYEILLLLGSTHWLFSWNITLRQAKMQCTMFCSIRPWIPFIQTLFRPTFFFYNKPLPCMVASPQDWSKQIMQRLCILQNGRPLHRHDIVAPITMVVSRAEDVSWFLVANLMWSSCFCNFHVGRAELCSSS